MRRYFWVTVLLVVVFCFLRVDFAVAGIWASPQQKLLAGDAKPALEAKHFPDRLHTFVWRNWESVSLERMAEVLDTTVDNVRKIGQSMGLPPHIKPTSEYQQLGYISLIRRNWHLLPYDQLLVLLGWDAEKLTFALYEEDVLWWTLGAMKPFCSPLRYKEPDETTKKRCAKIKAIVSSYFADEFTKASEQRFNFVRVLSAVDKCKKPTVSAGDKNEPLRLVYPYFAPFADPLLNSEPDPFPEGLIQKLAERGVNGLWLHSLLRRLAPSKIFPEFGADHEKRLANLRKIVERGKRYGVKIYLYLNEPRRMPPAFFKGREYMMGVEDWGFYAMCTSVPEVRQWLKESLTYVFRQVPDLGGVFTITASENLTHCWTRRPQIKQCPRCSKRTCPEVTAEVNRTIAEGVWAGNPDAKIIVWDWGWHSWPGDQWPKEWDKQIIDALPDGVYFMTVSERDKPIKRGGVEHIIDEYALTTFGPGPRALRRWALARQRGLKPVAKVQVNCTIELFSLPYLPVMNTVAQHCANLHKAGVRDLMLSWTLGGYPSPNLQLVKEFSARSAPTVEQALRNVAAARYGDKAADDVLRAWGEFSTAFGEYPFHRTFLHRGPMQIGPANLLYPEPTGYSATMIGFPYDDLEQWRAIYPADILAGQLEKMASGWKRGLVPFEKAIGKTTTSRQRANAVEDFRIAEAACLYFRSVANQIKFIVARNTLLSESLTTAERKANIKIIKETADDEIQVAKRFFTLARQDSRIGFDTNKQYYYFPLDLVEKVISCEYILNNWLGHQCGQQ